MRGILRRLAHNDEHVVLFVLVACSMALTAYFGWTFGDDSLFLCLIFAGSFSGITYITASRFRMAGRYFAEGRNKRAILACMIGGLFAVLNILTDYGAGAAVRDMLMTRAGNANTLAADVRHEVKRLTARIDDLKSQAAWRTALEAPDAHRATIANLEGHYIFKRSKGCTDQTLRDTFEHCEKWRTARANLALSEQRQVLKAELRQLESDLVRAKLKSAETQEVSSAAMAQVRALVSWVTLLVFGNTTGDQTDTSIFWGNNTLLLVFSICFTIGITYLSFELGSHVPMQPATEPRRAPIALPAEPTPLDPQEAAQRAADRHSRMEVYRSTHTVEQQRDDKWERLKRELEGLDQEWADRMRKFA